MLSFEVTWNGGPLLPPRPERTAAIYSDSPGERETVRPDVIRTGRFCACGCGEEMVYSRTTNRAKRVPKFKPGHAKRMTVYTPRNCKGCGAEFTPQVGGVTTFCTASCQSLYYRRRRKKRELCQK